MARANLEKIDTGANIRDNELGYWTVKKSGLDGDEKRMVLARADESFTSSKISTALKSMSPRGM